MSYTPSETRMLEHMAKSDIVWFGFQDLKVVISDKGNLSRTLKKLESKGDIVRIKEGRKSKFCLSGPDAESDVADYNETTPHNQPTNNQPNEVVGAESNDELLNSIAELYQSNPIFDTQPTNLANKQLVFSDVLDRFCEMKPNQEVRFRKLDNKNLRDFFDLTIKMLKEL